MKVLVFNGWAAGPETWALCTFPHDWVFDYVEQLDGLPEKVMEESDEVVLVGFSMGGSTALRMWLKYPEKVKGLVLVSATPRMMEEKKSKGEVEEVVLKRIRLPEGQNFSYSMSRLSTKPCSASILALRMEYTTLSPIGTL